MSGHDRLKLCTDDLNDTDIDDKFQALFGRSINDTKEPEKDCDNGKPTHITNSTKAKVIKLLEAIVDILKID